MAKSKAGLIPPNLDMLENGLDFIKSGVSYIMSGSKVHDYKYPVLHISSGVEIILKERLLQENYSLIFQDMNKADLADFNSGNFVSVYFDEIIKRLKDECGIVLPKPVVRTFKRLRSIRNQFEHFAFKGNAASIQPVALGALSHILSFIHNHLDESLISVKSAEIMEELQEILNSYEDYVKVRMDQIKPELDEAAKKHPVELCPNCQKPALVINEELCCKFCNFKEEPDVMANLYAENILNESSHECYMHGGEFPVHDCVSCTATDTMVDKGGEFVCFACGEQKTKDALSYCSSCGILFEDPDSEMCGDCWRNIFDSKD